MLPHPIWIFWDALGVPCGHVGLIFVRFGSRVWGLGFGPYIFLCDALMILCPVQCLRKVKVTPCSWSPPRVTLAFGGMTVSSLAGKKRLRQLRQVETNLDFPESCFWREKTPAVATTGWKKLVLISGTGFLTETFLKTNILDQKIVKKQIHDGQKSPRVTLFGWP